MRCLVQERRSPPYDDAQEEEAARTDSYHVLEEARLYLGQDRGADRAALDWQVSMEGAWDACTYCLSRSCLRHENGMMERVALKQTAVWVRWNGEICIGKETARDLKLSFVEWSAKGRQS